MKNNGKKQSERAGRGHDSKVRWSSDDIVFLVDNYDWMMTEDIANYLRRTVDAVMLKARRMGLKKTPCTNYRAEEEVFIANNYKTMRDQEIADTLGRTLHAIRVHRRRDMNLPRVYAVQPRHADIWAEFERERIKAQHV